MIRLRVLHIEFENPIEAYEIPAFRAAIVKTAGRENLIFHNHLKNEFLYKYPLIQYKRNYDKPVIICIDKGVDEIHNFFENKQEGLILGDRNYNLKISKLKMNQFNMQVWDKSFNYYLRNWLALNQKNFEDFKKINSEIDQIEFLEKILTGNILSFAKGINWHLDKELKVRIKEIKQRKIVSVKNIRREAFSLLFTTNAFLPNFIGLGKNASLGYGVVREYRTNEKSYNYGQ